MNEYEDYDALGLAELIRTGQTTPEELLEAALSRVEARDGEIGAIVLRMEEEARTAIQRGLPDGPFAGVPFLLKDLNLAWANSPLTNGSRLFEGLRPDRDSELVARYRRAGLVVFGRSASPECGLTTTTESALHGVTRNPWRASHTAGGSSGGAAAAVAAGYLPMANASDGGGSIRIPASCCGLFGLKPTRGRTPAGPFQGEGWAGMSVNHVVSRSVRDSAVLLDLTAGPDAGAPYAAQPPARPWADEVGVDPGRLRIAVQTRSFNGQSTHPDCVAAVEDAAGLLGELGHHVDETAFTPDERLRDEIVTIIAANIRVLLEDRASALGRELRRDDVEPGTWRLASMADEVTTGDYVRAVKAIHAAGRAFAAHMARFDLVLTPTMATPPVEIGVLSLSSEDAETASETLLKTIAFTQLFNATGNPAASVPLAWNDMGLPVGVQLVAGMNDEAVLLRLASQLEQAVPWFNRRAPVES